MSSRDEEIQKNFEKGHIPDADSVEVKAYRQVFRALKKDPGYALPEHFAAGVVSRLDARKRSQDARDHFWFGAGIFFIALAFVATILYTGLRVTRFTLDLGFLSAMADYKGLALFGLIFILLLNWLDKRLLRSRHVPH